MSHLHFDGREAMEENLSAARHNRLHPTQEALTYGDYWVQFHDITKRVIRFGHVLTQAELREQMIDDGMVAADIDDMLVMAGVAMREQGILYSRRFDFIHHPDGVFDTAVKAHVWPIEQRLFDAAREHRWQIDPMEQWAKVLLDLAFRQQRAAVRGEN
jgi:hypothetical protein